MQLLTEHKTLGDLRMNTMLIQDMSSHNLEAKDKASNASLLMNPVASGDNVTTGLNSAHKIKDELPPLVPCCEGRELQISEDLVCNGLSAISVKHDGVVQCLSMSCACDKMQGPPGFVKHRNSFRSLHRPDLKRVPYLRRMTPDELEALFRGYSDIPSLGVTKTGTACKMRWNNIRDNFRKNLYKNTINKRQGKKLVRPYRYHNELTFLTKYLGTKNATENIEDFEITDGNDEQSSQPNALSSPLQEPMSPASESGVLSRPSPSPVRETALPTSQPSPVPDSRQNIYVTNFSTAHRGRLHGPINRQDSSNSRTGAPEVLDYLIQQSDEPVNAFLASIAPTLRELHPCDWFEAKSELFALVQKYEAKLLRQRFAMTRTGGDSDSTNPNNKRDQVCNKVIIPANKTTGMRDIKDNKMPSRDEGNSSALKPIPETRSGAEDVPAGMRLHGARARLYTSVLAGAKAGDQMDNASTSEEFDATIPDDVLPEDEVQLNEELQIILPPRCDDVTNDSMPNSESVAC